MHDFPFNRNSKMLKDPHVMRRQAVLHEYRGGGSDFTVKERISIEGEINQIKE